MYSVILDEFTPKSLPTLCGSSEAEKRTYKLVGQGRRYLIANQDNSADNIYVEGGPNSDGFGGRTLTFKLEDGSEISLRGPWHTNSEDLLRNTGVDIRHKHATCGVIGLKSEYKNDAWRPTIKQVIFKDDDWVIGTFTRIENLAQEIANELNQTVYYYVQSQGGSCSGSALPKV